MTLRQYSAITVEAIKLPWTINDRAAPPWAIDRWSIETTRHDWRYIAIRVDDIAKVVLPLYKDRSHVEVIGHLEKCAFHVLCPSAFFSRRIIREMNNIITNRPNQDFLKLVQPGIGTEELTSTFQIRCDPLALQIGAFGLFPETLHIDILKSVVAEAGFINFLCAALTNVLAGLVAAQSM